MKSIVATLALLASAHAFVVPSNDVRSSTALQAEIGRRQFASVAFSAAVIGGASPAFAFGSRGEDYVPKYKDLKLIYELGVSLDRLASKFEDPNTVYSALEGVRMFNKDPNFYPGYAKNYISKSVLHNADADPRIGYVRQACKLVGSTEALMDADAGLDDSASKEAVARVKKGQALIAKFLAESGVKTEEVDAFISAHP